MTYVDSGGLRLFYSGSGTGPPLLWHTGGCGDGTMRQTAGYIAALPGYRQLLFDHRGHGRSAAPATIRRTARPRAPAGILEDQHEHSWPPVPRQARHRRPGLALSGRRNTTHLRTFTVDTRAVTMR